MADKLTFTLDTGDGENKDVVIKLRPDLAPGHVERITELVGDMAAPLRANAQVAIDYRESLGSGLLATYNDGRLKFDEFLSGLQDADRDKPCYHPAGTISVETYLNLRLTELIVHEWDIRSSLEPEPVMSAESLPAIIEMFPVFVVGRLFDPGANMTATARFRFEQT